MTMYSGRGVDWCAYWIFLGHFTLPNSNFLFARCAKWDQYGRPHYMESKQIAVSLLNSRLTIAIDTVSSLIYNISATKLYILDEDNLSTLNV